MIKLNENIISDSVFEALFRQAVIDNFNEEINSLPSDEELAEKYTFSQEHELRMKKLFVREERREKLQFAVIWAKRAAAAIIIIATLSLGSLLFAPNVRAAVYQTVTQWYERFVRFTSDAPETEKTNLEPGYVPEGFVEITREEIPMISTIIYMNAYTDKTITFISSLSAGSASVDREGHNYTVIEIEDVEYHTLTTEDGDSEHYVIWENDGQRYTIASAIPIEELLKIAISVK